MIVVQDRSQLVAELARTMDELCAPELTLARSEVLRGRVAGLLERLRGAGDAARPGAEGRADGAPRMVGVA